MTTKPEVIGIDLGGTAIKLGRFDRAGNCTASLTLATPQPATPDAVIAAMGGAIARLDPDKNAIAIGIGLPGPVDAKGRLSKIAINLCNWQNVPLADEIEQHSDRPCVIANDANCAGLGEAWLGAGRGISNLILITLGTGVGGAVILDDRLFVGRNGAAGELGLITFNPNGPECNSGNNGSLEQYVSVRAIRRETGLDPHELAKKARNGDTSAIAFWQDYGRKLGAGLASSLYILTPEAVIIGGGISASADLFLPSTKVEVDRRVLPDCRDGLKLLVAELGNRAGMVGAAKLAWQLTADKMGD